MAIEIENITKEHIEYALNYIVRHGQRGRNDIFYLYHPMFNRGIEHEVDGKKVYVSVRETVRIAVLYDMQKMPEEGVVSIEAVKSVSRVFQKIKANPRAFVMRLGFRVNIFSRDVPEDDVSDGDEQNIGRDTMDKALSLLRQIGQIIFYGPPGTGKTFLAKKLLPNLLDVNADEIPNEKKRWSIVQFHPSYNYEDFVRGVKVGTSGNSVLYKTENRIFGDICKRAKDDPENDYALIIDEINRANVSAVLGELIYGLEYRGESIKTPYTADGDEDSNLIIPKNLYIIGTMNTADRTIGKIDYAVRRRFAFVHCPPIKSVIKNKDARDAFSDVNAIFNEHISPDYDADDVRIGHSYFLPKSHENLADKIVYQVVPILREYVKDGVLLEGAKDEISAIQEEFSDDITASDELEGESGNNSSEESKGKPFYYWENDGRFGINGIGRTVLSITQDYVSQHPEKTLKEVQAWFPDRGKNAMSRGIRLASEIKANDQSDRFFTNEEDRLIIKEETAYVTSQWNRHETGDGSLGEFIEGVKKSSYVVTPCYIVKIGEEDKVRSWDECEKFNFVAASGVTQRGHSFTKMLRELEKADILFAFLMGADGKKGFIAMGEVVEKAVPIKEFKVEGIPLLDCVCSDGQKYRDKHPLAAEYADDEKHHDWMVRVKWKTPPLSREELEGTTVRQHVTYNVITQKNLRIIKRKFEKAE